MGRNMNPILKALFVAALFALVCLAGMYVRSAFIVHGPFEPDWAIIGAAAALSFFAQLAHTWIQR